MNTLRAALCLTVFCAAPAALAQEDDLGLPNPYELRPPAGEDDDAFDRPLARALAFDRKDLVESLLVSPTQLATHDVPKLAQDLAIPRAHAALAIAAAQAGVDVSNKLALLARGLPEGVAQPAKPNALTGGMKKLRGLGMTEVQAAEFIRWQSSAARVAQHAAEVKAIREVRVQAGVETARSAQGVLESRGVGRVQAIAQALGMVAPEAETRAAELRALQERDARPGVSARHDPVVEFRRVDGTIDWARFSQAETMRGAGGVLHFAFALFLKELAVVLQTGDQARLDEFVDGLLTTDFYVNYGLFAAGARAADGIYGQYVRRLSQKRFMNRVMRSNLVLAAGLAVPMAVRGQFELDTYVVDVAALGLSVTAVKAALEGTQGVYRLVAGNRALRLGKLASPAGWVFTGAETAVVLLLGDVLANEFDQFMDERELRGLVRDSQDDLWKVVQAIEQDQNISEAEVEAAVGAVESAYDRLRQYKLDPLKGRLALFQVETESIARQALRGETHVEAMAKALEAQPALRTFFAGRHGSAEAYLEALRAGTSGAAEQALADEDARFGSEWEHLIRSVYEGATSADAPAPAEGSRLATYDEQSQVLLQALEATDDPQARELIALAIARVRMGRSLDRTVYQTGAAPAAPAEGLVQGLQALSQGE